jgi:hypothetical protein
MCASASVSIAIKAGQTDSSMRADEHDVGDDQVENRPGESALQRFGVGCGVAGDSSIMAPGTLSVLQQVLSKLQVAAITSADCVESKLRAVTCTNVLALQYKEKKH